MMSFFAAQILCLLLARVAISKGDDGGSADGVTRDQFMNAVTDNGFPQPREEQWEGFRTGITRGDTISSKREAAMALAQFLHESKGLTRKIEEACAQDGCPQHYRDPDCDVEGKLYFGRGYIQLTWCNNYRAAGNDLGLGDALRADPERVANDDNMSWATTFSFWRREVHNARGVQDGQFGATTKAINGQQNECQGNGQMAEESNRRFQYYRKVYKVFGISGEPDPSGCNIG